LKYLSAISMLLLILCATRSASAQSTDATISGVVVDPAGKVIPDAAIEIVNDATGVHYSSTTNGAGIYTVTILPPAQYRVQVSKTGFKTLIKPGIVLNVQSAVAINFTLPLGATSESVTVESGTSAMNTTDGSVSTVIDRTFVENMPLNGRSFQDLLTLSPGVSQVPVNAYGGVGYSGEIVVNGQRTEANYFTVDGVSANTGVSAGSSGQGAGAAGGVAGESALGTTQSLASIDDLQEFRATTSTYSAEYGRTPGAQFSFTTRSGGNEFHGSAYDYLRNDAMDASNWFNDYLDQPKGKERQNDFGGTLGGPVLLPHLYDGRKATFFFVSYEGLRLDSPQASQQVGVPDVALRQDAPVALQPALNAFPLPNGGEDGLNDGIAYYIQTTSYPAQLDSTSIRVDRHLTDSWNIFGRYAYTPSSNASYTEAVENLTTAGVQSLTLGSTNTVTLRQNNDLRFNFTRNTTELESTSTNLGGATPFDVNALPGFGSGNAALAFFLDYGSSPGIFLRRTPSAQSQYNITDAYSWTIGHHNLRAGIDWRRLETQLTLNSPKEGIYFLAENEVLTNTALIGAVVNSPVPQVAPVYLNFSSFLQDEWKATPRLSLSLGLRWDINPAPGNASGGTPYTLTQTNNLATTILAPAGTPLWKTDWRGFAPRFGLAYGFNQSPGRETVLRAGYGIFFDMGNVLGSSGYDGIGFSATDIVYGVSFPLTLSQITLPPPSAVPPYSDTVYAFDPDLKLPYSSQYNASLEQRFTSAQSMTVGYVASTGRRLLTDFLYSPSQIGNTNFTDAGAVYLTGNGASSSYNSLQVKYQTTLSHGIQSLLSYTWSHSIDNASANALLGYLLRGSSDFDIRHQLQAAVTWNAPSLRANSTVGSILNHWSADLRVQARSSLPVDITGPQVIVPETGELYSYQPDLVPNQPIYLRGNAYPGRRIINDDAFTTAPSGVQGNLPRNFARGFDAIESDIALRRTIAIREGLNVQFRAEAFNLFNHPEFGAIYSNLEYGPGQFGYAYNTVNGQLGGLNPLYQSGGPRSLQVMLRLSF
jgi:Carboxypeptidase regulatory-like domain/TonB-dependent Receptor Plug Domain